MRVSPPHTNTLTHTAALFTLSQHQIKWISLWIESLTLLSDGSHFGCFRYRHTRLHVFAMSIHAHGATLYQTNIVTCKVSMAHSTHHLFWPLYGKDPDHKKTNETKPNAGCARSSPVQGNERSQAPPGACVLYFFHLFFSSSSCILFFPPPGTKSKLLSGKAVFGYQIFFCALLLRCTLTLGS